MFIEGIIVEAGNSVVVGNGRNTIIKLQQVLHRQNLLQPKLNQNQAPVQARQKLQAWEVRVVTKNHHHRRAIIPVAIIKTEVGVLSAQTHITEVMEEEGEEGGKSQ
jgi:hypothetical protein